MLDTWLMGTTLWLGMALEISPGNSELAVKALLSRLERILVISPVGEICVGKALSITLEI
jgi:hypothetical protein